jgi:hypothetical protein
MAFAGGYGKTRVRGAKRSGGLGIRSFGKGVPFGAKSNLRGTAFSVASSAPRGARGRRNGSLS